MTYNKERLVWKSKREYILSCIGYAVGLGNIWRFPYLCFESGGGAFLIPYFVTLILCGVPLMYLELAVGQYTGHGPVQAIGQFCPLMKGVGVATTIITFILSIYYNVIVSWAIYYFVHSFNTNLPWYRCDAEWSTSNCTNLVNSTLASNSSVAATEEFFENEVLQKTSGIDDMGVINWKLFICFVTAWMISYICIYNGIKSVGKIVHITATFPYFILITLLIASCTLEGAIDGIIYFFKPRWSEILNMNIWINAAAQNFNSIGISFGALIAFSSYNHRNNNILHDTLLVTSINSFTSLLAGSIIFAAMGHMAHSMSSTVEKVVKEGPELIFIVYPQIFKQLPAPYIWAILFFLMMIMLSVDSQFSMVEVVIKTLTDAFDGKIVKNVFRGNRKLLTASVCLFEFLCGIPLIFEGGIYVFTLLDSYTAIISLMFIAFFEIIAICWLYGGKRLARDIEEMTSRKTRSYFVFCWLVVCPCLIGINLCFMVGKYELATYGDYRYPTWANVIGWFITLSSIICIPIFAIKCLIEAPGSSLWQRMKFSIKPTVRSGTKIDVNSMNEEEMKSFR